MNIKKIAGICLTTGMTLGFSVTSIAEIVLPNVFKTGDVLTAPQLNDNFNALKSGIDTNTTATSNIESLTSRVSNLEQTASTSIGDLQRSLTGLVSMSINSLTVNGTGTLFTNELNVGDALKIGNEVFNVASITSDTSLTVSAARTNPDVIDSVAQTDNDLLALKTGAGENKVTVTKSGQMIRQISRATGAANDSRDTGFITGRSLSFNKAKDTTAMRIGYSDNFRVTGTSKACRWEITVDDVSCPDYPLIFDFYSDAGNTHRSTSMFGYCEGVSAGTHTIKVKVGSTPGYTASDCFTGWSNSRWTLEAEETY